MPFAGLAAIILDIFCIIHIYRTGRPKWWAMIVFMIPVFGAVIYLLFEVFPHSREGVKTSRAINRTIDNIHKSVDPSRDLRALAADAEACGSVDNRVALAKECMDQGMGEEAVKRR